MVSGEALAGERAGQVLSCIKPLPQSADGVPMHGRQHAASRYCEKGSGSAQSKTLYMLRNTLSGTGRAHVCPRATRTGRIEKSKDTSQ